jgi:4-hydroxy-tetrahydrodipicolinate reductase
MTRLALVGYGKMGRLVEQLAPEHGFEVVARLSGHRADEAIGSAEVAIDFSTAAAVADNAAGLAALGIPLVIGTTGWQDDLERVRRAVEEHGTGLVHGANFSIGVQIFYRLAAEAGRLLAAEEDYGAWLYEIHHRHKKDAPSGTLREIRRTLEEAGYALPVDVASNRAGAVPGTHVLGFDSEADTITLQHTARSRTGFARGALRAARWVLGRRGFFEFSQVWEEIVAER